MEPLIPPKAPALPLAAEKYSATDQERTNGILRRYFNTLDNALQQLLRGQVAPVLFATTYGPAVAIDAALGNEFDITATNGTAFTVSSPTNGNTGQRITITVRNTSGGALGVVTWGAAFRMSAWTSPANGNNRSVDFRLGSDSLWVQVAQTGTDVPN